MKITLRTIQPGPQIQPGLVCLYFQPSKLAEKSEQIPCNQPTEMQARTCVMISFSRKQDGLMNEICHVIAENFSSPSQAKISARAKIFHVIRPLRSRLEVK